MGLTFVCVRFSSGPEHCSHFSHCFLFQILSHGPNLDPCDYFRPRELPCGERAETSQFRENMVLGQGLLLSRRHIGTNLHDVYRNLLGTPWIVPSSVWAMDTSSYTYTRYIGCRSLLISKEKFEKPPPGVRVT